MRKLIAIIIVFFAIQSSSILFGSAISFSPVIEVDIGISSSSYKHLISQTEKKPYDIYVKTTGDSEYRTATINIRGYSSKEIGLLTKTKRIPFEVSFPEVQFFSGLENKSVKFINSFTPYRLIAEYLALDLFDFAGIPTPAHSLAFIRFNGVDFGLYIAVEDVNKPFLRKWYKEPLGSAYKATFDNTKAADYVDSEWFGVLFEKVSGESNHFAELISSLDRGEGYEQYVDLDEWLRYFACVAVIGGDGSIFSEQNNFVLYDNNGKYQLIPWDLSEAFSGRETVNGIDRYYIWDELNNPNPLFDLIMKNPANRAKYHEYIRQFADGFLSPDIINKRFNEIIEAISPYLSLDHSIFLNSDTAREELLCDSPDSLLSLRHTLTESYKNLLYQLSGIESVYFSNELFSSIYNEDFEVLVPMLEKQSSKYDPLLPKKIESSYAKWNQTSEAQTRDLSVPCLIGIISVVFAGTIVYCMKKRRKKKA